MSLCVGYIFYQTTLLILCSPRRLSLQHPIPIPVLFYHVELCFSLEHNYRRRNVVHFLLLPILVQIKHALNEDVTYQVSSLFGTLNEDYPAVIGWAFAPETPSFRSLEVIRWRQFRQGSEYEAPASFFALCILLLDVV